MRIAIATQAEPLEFYPDMQLLGDAIRVLGGHADICAWDDPAIDWAAYDAVLIDSTWDYTEKYDQFIQWCESVAAVTRLVNPYEIVRLSSNKRYILTLQEAGVPVPASTLTHGDPQDTMQFRHTGKVVIKPVIGASGEGAACFENLAAAVSSPAFVSLCKAGEVLVQDYQADIKTKGECSAIFFEGKLSHCVLKIPGEHDFRVQHQYGGRARLAEAPPYIHELYQHVTGVLRVAPIYMRLDFIPAEKPLVMEVEMVEPSKYFSLYPEGAQNLAKILLTAA